jgi:thioredoxin-related protein
MSNLTLFIVALVIVLLILLVYQWKIANKVVPYNVLLFYRDGCPYCEVFKSEWARVEQVLKDRAKKFNTMEPKAANLATQYGVSGVPTIIFVGRGGGYETYSGSRTADDIIARFA